MHHNQLRPPRQRAGMCRLCVSHFTPQPTGSVTAQTVQTSPMFFVSLGLYRHRGMPGWRLDQVASSDAGFLTADAVSLVTRLTSAVQELLRCRWCARRIFVGSWTWRRRESIAHRVLTPNIPPELGVQFECGTCKGIHIAEPLPDAMVDACRLNLLSRAVKIVLSTLPSLYHLEISRVPSSATSSAGSVTPRPANGHPFAVPVDTGGGYRYSDA